MWGIFSLEPWELTVLLIDPSSGDIVSTRPHHDGVVAREKSSYPFLVQNFRWSFGFPLLIYMHLQTEPSMNTSNIYFVARHSLIDTAIL